jgi:outer membrane receptor protein involved in Fe transport
VSGVTINTLGTGRWIGASPDAWNLTLYYDGENWSTRVSSAFRSGYVYKYPIAGGNDQIGYGNAPLVNDFWNSKNTFNVDLSASYDVTENIGLTLDALNLTNQPDRRWAYQATPQTAKYASTGRQVFVGFRIKN